MREEETSVMVEESVEEEKKKKCAVRMLAISCVEAVKALMRGSADKATRSERWTYHAGDSRCCFACESLSMSGI